MLAVHVSVTECETGWTPVPDSVTDAGELVALLVTYASRDELPFADGVKVTFSVAVCPGVTICPDEMPLAVYPAPDMHDVRDRDIGVSAIGEGHGQDAVAADIDTGKIQVVWLALSVSVAAALTVSVAALLVVLPALLVTVTVNCAPLSPDVVAGVVYEDEVAPLIAVPPFFH